MFQLTVSRGGRGDRLFGGFSLGLNCKSLLYHPADGSRTVEGVILRPLIDSRNNIGGQANADERVAPSGVGSATLFWFYLY